MKSIKQSLVLGAKRAIENFNKPKKTPLPGEPAKKREEGVIYFP